MDSSRATTAGFSLIEVLASLAILSLLASVVFMNLTPLVDERRMDSIHAAVENALEQARTENIFTKQRISLNEFVTAQYPELVPFLTMSSDLQVVSNGACNAGTVEIRYAERSQTYQVSALTCAMTRIA